MAGTKKQPNLVHKLLNMFNLLTKPLCQKISKFSIDRLTDRQTDKAITRSSILELKKWMLRHQQRKASNSHLKRYDL